MGEVLGSHVSRVSATLVVVARRLTPGDDSSTSTEAREKKLQDKMRLGSRRRSPGGDESPSPIMPTTCPLSGDRRENVDVSLHAIHRLRLSASV